MSKISDLFLCGLSTMVLCFLGPSGCGPGNDSPPIEHPPLEQPRERDPAVAPATYPEPGSEQARPQEPERSTPPERQQEQPPDSLKLTVLPADATVLLVQTGQLLVRTNLQAGIETDLGPVAGEVELLVSAPGHQPERRTLAHMPRSGRIEVHLQPVSGKLHVQANASTQVRVMGITDGDTIYEGITDAYGTHETLLPEGDYEIELTKEHHVATRRHVEIRRGAPVRIETRLPGKPASLWIASAREAEVWLNDQPIGMTGSTITHVPPGRHELVFRSKGYRPAYKRIVLEPGSYRPLSAPELQREQGSINITPISSREHDDHFAQLEKTILLSQQPPRQTTGSALFGPLPSGEYDLAIQAPGYRMQQENPRVQIDDARTNHLTVRMKPQKALTHIETDPPDTRLFGPEGPLPPGTREVHHPPFEPLELRALREGYATRRILLPPRAPASRTNITIRLERVQMIEELIVNPSPRFPPTDHLAPGSSEAQTRQIEQAEKLRLPIEVQAARSGILLRLVPAGSFLMGSPPDEPGHRPDETYRPATGRETGQPATTVEPAFYMSAQEITWRIWRRVMGRGPGDAEGVDLDAPVERVSWNDCQVFLEELCALEGVPPGTYRLPTEAEWEYACRAGTQTATYNASTDHIGNRQALERIAWFADSTPEVRPPWPEAGPAGRRRAPANPGGPRRGGLKEPNAWGLYDMLGNVWEWCHDLYRPRYGTDHQAVETALARTMPRVSRGGGWSSSAQQCRAAQRYPNSPNYRDRALGFRVVRILPTPP